MASAACSAAGMHRQQASKLGASLSGRSHGLPAAAVDTVDEAVLPMTSSTRRLEGKAMTVLLEAPNSSASARSYDPTVWAATNP